ncbi:CYTH and CHAD domain-containing protein [uncultured Nocardioides sp.]|uniref:CYTH and CHAD domain-containing protein n=1 Tax=uncultured Nocardioides sp. TaxID=198441 RepID=UPI0026230F3A|nr:CYTH and CHAD domain-containing protein [uncultured Nocardioides sp.]
MTDLPPSRPRRRSGSHHEVERTYTAGPDAGPTEELTLPDLVGTGPVTALGAAVTAELDATYLDTVDLRLTRAGITLRRREGGADEGWHLKLPVGRGRDEVQRPLGRATTPPKPLRDLVTAWTAGAELAPVARIRTERTTHDLVAADGSVLAEVADDRTTAMREDTTYLAWREVEVELVDGDEDVLDALEERLLAAGFVPASVGRKIERALADVLPPAEDAPRISTKRPVHRLVHARLVQQLDELRRYEVEVRRRRPDAVHQVRVAARRLRAALRTFAPLFEGEAADELQRGLQQLTRALGGERDLEVAAERVEALLAETPDELLRGPVRTRLRTVVRDRMREHRAATATELAAPHHLALLADLDRFVADPPWAPEAKRRTRDVAPRLLAKDGKRVAKRFAAASDDDGLHRARSAAKRLRYAGEALVPAYGKDAERVAATAKHLQQPLGTLQDTRLSRALLLEAAAAADAAGESSFTYGVWHEWEALAADEARDLARARWKRASKRRKGKGLRLS